MKRLWQIVTFCAVVLLALFANASVALASSETGSLPPGFLVGDDTGFQAGTDGEYFIVNNNIVPGGTFSRTITLSNYSTKDGSFQLNLVMNPEDAEHVPEITGAVNLLEAISVVLTYQDKEIYRGPISGDGMPAANKKTAPLKLGRLEVGEVRNIKADFTVSNDYPESDWAEVNSVDFYWLFFASREEEPPPDSSSTPDSSKSPDTSTPASSLPSTGGKLPQTGEDWRNVLLGMIAGFALITVALIIAKKRHERDS